MCWEGRVSHRPFWLQLCVPGQNQPEQHDALRPQPLPIPDPGKVREERGPKLRDPSVLSPIQSPPASSPTPVLFSTLMIASQNHWPGLCWKICPSDLPTCRSTHKLALAHTPALCLFSSCLRTQVRGLGLQLSTLLHAPSHLWSPVSPGSPRGSLDLMRKCCLCFPQQEPLH